MENEKRNHPLSIMLMMAAITIGAASQSARSAILCAPDTLYGSGMESIELSDFTQAGPYTSGTLSGTSTISGRVTPWVATYPNSATSVPLVVFIPGFQVPIAAYSNWAQNISSWGFAVVLAEPPAPFFSPNHVEMSQDVQNVVTDLIAPGALPILVNAAKIAVGGHLLGGKIALMAAASDARIKAVLVLDPANAPDSDGSSSSSAPNIVPSPVSDIVKPIGIFGELLDSSSGSFQPCSPAAINFQTLFQAAVGARPAYEWTLAGAGTMSFVSNIDQCGFLCSTCATPTLPLAQAQSFIGANSVAFLETHLNNVVGICRSLTIPPIPGFATLRWSNAH